MSFLEGSQEIDYAQSVGDVSVRCRNIRGAGAYEEQTSVRPRKRPRAQVTRAISLRALANFEGPERGLKASGRDSVQVNRQHTYRAQ